MNQLLLIAFLVLSVGCAHTVNYKLTDAERWTGNTIDKVVRVETFLDQTPPPVKQEKEIIEGDLHPVIKIIDQRTIKQDGATWRINYRDGYANQEIAKAVTLMLIKHLKHAGLFRDVVDASNGRLAEYELSGTIKTYHAQGRVNSGAETGFILGGMVAGAPMAAGFTAGQETEIRVTIELTDLRLADLSRAQPVWQDSIVINTNFPVHWMAADQDLMFNHPDHCLKQAVTELIRRLAAIPQTPVTAK